MVFYCKTRANIKSTKESNNNRSKKQEIQSAKWWSYRRGICKRGTNCKKDEVIAKLDQSQFQASYEAIKSKVAALEATISRLRAEVFKKPLVFSQTVLEFPEFVSSQQELYKRRQEALNDEIETLQNSLKLAKDELNLNIPICKTEMLELLS